MKMVLTIMLDEEIRRYTEKKQMDSYQKLRRAVNELLCVVNVIGVEIRSETE